MNYPIALVISIIAVVLKFVLNYNYRTGIGISGEPTEFDVIGFAVLIGAAMVLCAIASKKNRSPLPYVIFSSVFLVIFGALSVISSLGVILLLAVSRKVPKSQDSKEENDEIR